MDKLKVYARHQALSKVYFLIVYRINHFFTVRGLLYGTYGIRTFPSWKTAPGQLPPKKYPLRTITPGLLSPGHISINISTLEYNLPGELLPLNFPQDNSPQNFCPRAIPLEQFPPGQLPGMKFPPRAIAPLIFSPRTFFFK